MTNEQIDRIGYQSDGTDDLKSCMDLIGKIVAANTNGEALSAVMDFRKTHRMAGARAALARPALTEEQELEAFKAWAGREYRNAETYTARDLAHGFNAWRAARA